VDLCDNGVGVPEEYQKMLFEKQFTTKSADEGTGLGLGISRRFMRAHGGDIEFIKSTPFTETIFRIVLPLKSENAVVNRIKAGAA
jgi:signal transduction histidine kinase